MRGEDGRSNPMRMIDADALIKHEVEADRMGAMLVVGKGYILNAPTIDAVPVVRCGECDRRIKSADLTNTVLCGWLHKITMNKDDFCSYGVKMEDKT
jgi:hypothetical protein